MVRLVFSCLPVLAACDRPPPDYFPLEAGRYWRYVMSYWYAPGVGLVKSVRRESTTSQALDKGEITLELEAYRL